MKKIKKKVDMMGLICNNPDNSSHLEGGKILALANGLLLRNEQKFPVILTGKLDATKTHRSNIRRCVFYFTGRGR